jgi:aspartate aminotransferase
MKLASRTKKIKPSPTLAITARANALRNQGRKIIGFGAGEPDFDTPENIKKAAIAAIESGFTKYTAVGGIDELKDAIIEKLKNENGLLYKRSQIIVSCGAKHSLYNIAQVLFEEGDEVIVPAPYWVSYPDIILLAGAQPVILDTEEEDGFKIRPELLDKAINERTRAVIINSPSNPTGAAYTEKELKRLAEIIIKHNLVVISDDIYEKIVYDGFDFQNIASVCPEIRNRTIVVNGVSKSYSMTGWRIGYAAGPEDAIAAATEMQSQNTSNPCSIAQKAAVEALKGDQKVIFDMVEEFRRRRDCIVAGLNRIPGFSCLKPAGAFYVFPNVSGVYGRSGMNKVILNSQDLSEYLLEKVDVAVVPGSAFGNDKHIRLSYATSMKNIEEGVLRIQSAISELV